MARKTTLTGDLAALAEEERSRLGEPPDAELLVAYRDGELPEEEGERVRDRLAVDPEWAEIYLDLKRGGLDAPGVSAAGLDAPGAADADIDAAWRALATKLEREPPSAEAIPLPRRGPGRMLLALAATVAVAVGLGWWLAGRGGPGLPEGEYFDVRVRGETYRDLRYTVPSDKGVSFHIEAANLSGKLVIELLDASGEVVRREEQDVEAGTDEIVFRVAVGSLEDDKAYELVVRPLGASPGRAPILDSAFTIVFED